jgi:hypothetical protein
VDASFVHFFQNPINGLGVVVPLSHSSLEVGNAR